MVLLSFVLQVAGIGVFRQYHTRRGEDNFGFGFEMGRVGRSIALGQGFSSPYEGNTGPTAWEPPLYPYLIGGVFKIFGVYTYASAWVLLSINSLFAAFTTIPVYRIAHRTFGPRVALWSARTWALNPYVWYWSIHWIWDTTFTPLVLALIFLVALEMEQWPGWRGWALFGAVWGVGALANPTMLSFLPFCGLWVWWRRYRRGLRSLAGVVLCSLVFFLVLSPWLARNYEAFGRLVFIRDDFGLQLRLGNNKLADGISIVTLQPNLNKLELEKFQREALFLLLERLAQAHGQRRSVGLSQFPFSGVVRDGRLGIDACAAAETAGGVAFRRTRRHLSHDLLLRVPACPLPPSHRT